MVSKAKSAMVTGGGDGIGRAIAEAFIEAGAEVYICDTHADRVAQMNRPEQKLHAIQIDVSDETGVDHLFDQALNHFGGQLDVLVNNAGISGPTGPIESMLLPASIAKKGSSPKISRCEFAI